MTCFCSEKKGDFMLLNGNPHYEQLQGRMSWKYGYGQERVAV